MAVSRREFCTGLAGGVFAKKTGDEVLVFRPDASKQKVKATGGTVARTLAEMCADIVSVEDFGIKTDGSPNNTSKLSAVNEFRSYNKEKPMLYPCGLYAADGGVGMNISGKTVLDAVNVNGFSKQHRNTAGIVHYMRNKTVISDAYLNGGCCDDDYLYIAITKTDGSAQYIQKISLSTGLKVLEKTHTVLSHCNSMTCDASYVYVSPGVSTESIIYKLSKSTLEIVDTIDISSTAVYATGMAYDDRTERFFLRNGSGQNYFFIYDKNFNYITKTPCRTNPSGLSSQDICFYNGELYGFVFICNTVHTQEYLNYLVKYDHNGSFSQVWCLDIYREVENLCLCGDKFLVGVNTVYGDTYDFYLLDIATDTVESNSSFDYKRRKVEDIAVYPSRQLNIYATKDSTGSMLVGDGSEGNPFKSVNEAIFVAAKAAKENFNLHQINLIIQGDFSNEYIVLDHIPVTVNFSSAGVDYTIGPVYIYACKHVNFVNQNCKIVLSDAVPSSTTNTALEIEKSSAYVSVSVECTRANNAETKGFHISNSECIFGLVTIDIKNFNLGVHFYKSFATVRKHFVFANCTDNVKSFYSLVTTPTSNTNEIGYLFGDTYEAYISSVLKTRGLRVFNKSFPLNYATFSYYGSSTYNGLYIEPAYNGTSGANIVLRTDGSSNETGWFTVYAKSGDTRCGLTGTPSGNLTWNGNPIQTTSDERLKQDFSAVSSKILDAWGDVSWEAFRYKDAVKEKGENARTHVGLVAQHVIDAFNKKGLDACTLGIACYDKWDDQYIDVTVVDEDAVYDEQGNVTKPEKTHVEKKLEKEKGDLWTVRYTEALALECAYQRRRADLLEERVSALEERLAQLEARLQA